MKVAAAFFALLLTGAAAYAQPAGQADTAGALAPPEIQNLMDGYAIGQSQTALGLSDAEFGPFLPRFRALQNLRRRNEQERMRLLNELRRLSNPKNQGDESEIQIRLRALRDLETKSLSDMQHAYEAIDQSLNVRQQARFRLFEQEVEQRKLQLLMRARQQQQQQNRANRPNANRPNANGR